MRNSIIGSYYTLSACIDKIPEMEFEDWVAFNEEQKKYLAIYKNCRGAKIPEIESRVNRGDVTPVNEFLKERGFDIQLAQVKSPMDLAIASVLELALKWIDEGRKSKIHWNYQDYKAVDLESGVSVVYCEGFHMPVAKIVTKNGDVVYMTIPTDRLNNSFEVFEMARKLVNAKTAQTPNYEDRVIFPMIDIDTQPDISWIVGMSDALKEKWEIAEALQQTKVKMDEKGVVIKEAVAMTVRCMCASFDDIRQPLRIDEPFLFVVSRKGLKEPLFSAYLDVDAWIKREWE